VNFVNDLNIFSRLVSNAWLPTMANDPPPLALSDIMHPFTPSPSQEEDGEGPRSRSQSATPEPLDEGQIEAIKSRVSELGISNSEMSSSSSREQELLDMVCNLIFYAHRALSHRITPRSSDCLIRSD
jgi:hypothetical protein